MTSPEADIERGLERIAAGVRVVLVGTQLARNIGAAARAMKTMGLRRLVLVAPEQFPHPDACALASGAEDLLTEARVCASLAEAVANCVAVFGSSAHRRGIPLTDLDARGYATELLRWLPAGEVALVFGRERVGLTNAELEYCQYLIQIPTDPVFNSLNLAAAVQVLCYELRCAVLRGLMPAVAERIPAPNADLEHFFDHLERVLERIGFFGTKAPTKVLWRLRRMYQRALPDARELAILRGILSETERAAGYKSGRRPD